MRTFPVCFFRQFFGKTRRLATIRYRQTDRWDRCFAAAGPKLWNSLPADLRQADISFQRFTRLLKSKDIFCSGVEIAAHCVKAVPNNFLADLLRSCLCDKLASVFCLLSVTLCIVAKRCVLEQKLPLTAYKKSYVRKRLVPKWMTLTFV